MKELTELQKDAPNLLFALHDAWPYVHRWCTIGHIKSNITKLMQKHGDFVGITVPSGLDLNPLSVFAKECSLGTYTADEVVDAAKLALKRAEAIERNQ